MTDFRVCFVTAANLEQAKSLARLVLERRLAACVNIVSNVTSMYWWEGAITEDSEVMLVVKSDRSKVEELTSTIAAAHSYSVCEVLCLPVVAGNPAYLKWLNTELLADS